jgi:D-alanyl-lipoteichoic acid acyltransferase DltB (MBOAT superfamily)
VAFLSVDFFLLLPLAVLLYHVIPLTWRPLCLLAFSYVFYCTWSVPYAALFLVVSLIVQRLGLRVESSATDSAQKRYLAAGIASLGLLLFAFKYAPALGGRLSNLLVPLGVSYYTFKLVSYLVDVYWEKIPAERDVVAFLLFPVFFPQIVSGPIQRARDFLPQIKAPAPVDPSLIASGLRWILFGLFKKFVIADRLALFVNRVFDDPHSFGSVALLLATYAFAVQLYADFSGLTDFAIGVGRLFGIDSPQNFAAPFYAPNIQEFWRRWHITLTSWLTDYVFTPLRIAFRNRGDAGLALAIVVNMIAIGAWHGARWTFVVFGVVNALYMVVSAFTLKPRNRFFKRHPALAAVRAVAGPLVTFHLVAFALILFRATTLAEAAYIFKHALPIDLLGHSRLALVESLRGLGFSFFQIYWAVLAIPLMESVQFIHRRGLLPRLLYARPTWVRWSVYYAGILAILLVGELEAREFIYARF